MTGFLFYAPAIPYIEINQLAPKNDFALALVTTTTISDYKMKLHDFLAQPSKMITKEHGVLGQARPLDVVAAVGFPNALKEQYTSIGYIATDDDAKLIINEASKKTGIDVPYDPKTEIVVIGDGYHGMSGGGIFNQAGELVGVIVRAGAVEDISYIRATRTDFISKKIKALPPKRRKFYVYSKNQQKNNHPFSAVKESVTTNF